MGTLLANPDFVARFILFIVITISFERNLDQRLEDFLDRLDETGLLPESGREKGAAMVAKALRFRNSALPELVCAVAAIIMSAIPILSVTLDPAGADMMFAASDDNRMKPAGWWILLVSSPIFWFLLFRWIWRIAVWSRLLLWISRLELQLVVTHPDKSGGIAFMGRYPNAFSPIVTAFSFVLAAIVFRQVGADEMSLEIYAFVMGSWLTIVLVVFLSPLTAFVVPLARLKELALKEADTIDTRVQRKKERAAFGRNLVGPSVETVADTSGITDDPSKFRKAANELRLRPFSREAVLPLSGAALVPLLLAGSGALPIKELFEVAKKLVLL